MYVNHIMMHGHSYNYSLVQASLVTQTIERLSAMQETRVQSLGWEDPLEKEMAAHSSILAWKIPWTWSLVGYRPWGHKESDTTERLHFTSLHFTSLHFTSLPMKTQDWSPLGWTGWFSLQSKGLSRVFSSTTVQKYRFFGSQLSSQFNSHIHTGCCCCC